VRLLKKFVDDIEELHGAASRNALTFPRHAPIPTMEQ
jgi:hypothetical protein